MQVSEYKIKDEIKNKIASSLESFVDVQEILDETFEAFKGEQHDDVYESIWYGYRDEWVDELNDRLTQDLEVIGYAYGLKIALALGYWAGYNENSLGITIENGEDLGFVASYEWVQESGIVYDIVDEFLKDNFKVELNK